ncbi:hypothetical protein QBC44DRAFT_64179 [Cladorrhinum sp. PSN332]|nr:hypothetical protein QBC44DRAFT_64179 [Cladorrhinum sp. PSN332]
MAVQSQWALNATSSSVVSFSCDLIRVATSDNVQPLALLACQSFGATLAMSRETCDRIQADVLPTPSKHLVNFIKTSVGFSRHDCATQLGSSAAGLNFLGLAAALVTTMGAHESARALSIMLKTSAADPTTLLPTTYQLKELLLSLEPRLTRSLFTDSVVGWGFVSASIPSTREHSESSHPSAEAVEKIVDAFRRLSRIGEASLRKVRIRIAGKCVPWVTAFTKWCLGLPPSIVTQDGTAVILQPGSNVDIVASGNDEFVITMQHDLPLGPEDLIATYDSPKPWSGMVTIERYGQHMLEKLNIGTNMRSDEMLFRAFIRCASLTAARFLAQCRFVGVLKYHGRTESNPLLEAQQTATAGLHTSPFSDQSGQALSKIFTRMIYPHSPEHHIDIYDDKNTQDRDITELPDIKAYLQECRCYSCCQDYKVSTIGPCLKDSFLHNVSVFVADSLAISLFDSLTNEADLLVRVVNAGNSWDSVFLEAVSSILIQPSDGTLHSPRPVTCDIQHLIDWALGLAGHDIRAVSPVEGEGFWAMSCFRGQVIFPSIFEHRCIRKNGYLSLSLIRGVLEFEGHKYRVVRGLRNPTAVHLRNSAASDDLFHSSLPKEVIRPLNSLPTVRGLHWTVSVGDQILLLGVSLGPGDPATTVFDPFWVLVTLPHSLVVDQCPHDRASPLRQSDPLCTYVSPLNPTSLKFELSRETRPGQPASEIHVVTSDSSDDLRFYGLAKITIIPFWNSRISPGHFSVAVVRANSCLECCINVCRSTGCNLLIL